MSDKAQANDAPLITWEDEANIPEDERLEIVLEGDEKPEESETDETDDELPPEYKKKSKKEIVAKLQEIEEKNKTDASLTENLTTSIDHLGETLQQPAAPAPPPQQPVQPAQTTEELEAEVDELAFKEPSKAMSKLFETKYGPILRDQVSANASLQRELLEGGETTKDFFKDHAAEVDAEFAGLNPQEQFKGGGYKKAYRTVRSKYADEIITTEVKAGIDKVLPELTEKIRSELREEMGMPAKSNKDFTETVSGTPPAAVRKPRKVVMTDNDKDVARMRGVTNEEYMRWKLRQKGGKR